MSTALVGMQSVVDVGAGTGSYEPEMTLIAVEPSAVMIAQRNAGLAPCVQGLAEALPLPANSFDASMAVLTVHHWSDIEAGISELLRVSRRRIVILTWDQDVLREFWLVRDYLPEAAALDEARAIPISRLKALLPNARIEQVPIPHDCTDGFTAAFWRRPHAYLDPTVRAGISMLAQAQEEHLAGGLEALAADLESSRWQERYSHLLAVDELDVGYRLIISDL